MPRPTLLLAEADPRTLGVLELGLRKAGYAVRTAPDGEAALDALRASTPDLFICDLDLPGNDGLAVARAVRADETLAGLPLLMLCPNEAPALKARVIEAGADDVLGRPIHVQELAQRVALLLQHRKYAQAGPAPLHGKISDLGLLDLFTSLEDGRKSAVVRCEAPGQMARVWVRDGQVVDAELGSLAGDEAFWRLMTWGAGAYRVDFGEVDRPALIAGGTQGALAEALRRVDELVRSAESLPMGSHLRVDLDALAAKLRDLPDEVNGVLRCFDGQRTLRQAMDLSPFDDLATLSMVQRLMGDGILRAADGEAAERRPTLQQWLSDPPPIREGPAEDAAADLALAHAGSEEIEEAHAAAIGQGPAPGVASPPAAPELPRQQAAQGPPGLVHFPPLRGVRRERLRREAEEARARILRGEPVRLTQVVELPAVHPDKADAPGPGRFLSEAVGEAARKFAPDTPVARILSAPLPDGALLRGGLVASDPGAPLPAVAPVAVSTPGPPLRRKRPAWIAGVVGVAVAVVLIAGLRTRRSRPAQVPSQSRSVTEPAGAAAQPPAKADAAAYAKAMEQGESLISNGKYKAAVAEFKRAVDLRPTSQPALLALGDAYLEADLPRSAVEPLEAAALLDAKSSRAQLLLGTAYQSLGRNADAIAAYRRYLALEPQGRFSRDVQVILANLQKGR